MNGDPELSKEMKRFDFLEGEWDALCWSASPDGIWLEGPGTLVATKELDGCVSVERFQGPYCGSLIKGLGLRAFNRHIGQWEHTWTDSLEPGNFVVWQGCFAGESIDLYGDWKNHNGQHVLSRLTWSRITQISAHWVSHRSIDEGQTWSKHWEIQFKKKSVGGLAKAADARNCFTSRRFGTTEQTNDSKVVAAIAERKGQHEEAVEHHSVVSQWLQRRPALMDKEKQYLRGGDALAAEIRALPWAKVDKHYSFTSLQGDCSSLIV